MTRPVPDAVPDDQHWYWTAQWQEGEREAEREIGSGETTYCNDVEAMFDALNR